MVYNPPPTGHVLIILDNSTTAMTGHQEHPGTGRQLNHEPASKVILENLVRGVGVRHIHIVEPRVGSDSFARLLDESLGRNELTVIIARRPCILIARQLKQYEQRDKACECNGAPQSATPESIEQTAAVRP
jgi:indolepyruvate ferredoxin oxidoreductase alpha subunit